MKTLDIPQDLREKMLRRAERAFALYDQGSDEHVTRCSDVTRESLRYRISHKTAGTSGYYSGPKVLIHRVFPKSRWWNPLSWFGGKPYILVPETVGDDEHIIDHAPKALTMKADAKEQPWGGTTAKEALEAQVKVINTDSPPEDVVKAIKGILASPPDADHQWSEQTNTLPDPDDPDTDLTSIESI